MAPITTTIEKLKKLEKLGGPKCTLSAQYNWLKATIRLLSQGNGPSNITAKQMHECNVMWKTWNAEHD